MVSDIKTRSLLRNPLGAIGGALFAAGLLLFFVLLLIDLTGGAAANPYRSLVTFVIAPMITVLGFVLFMVSTWIQVRRARKKGERFRFNLTFDTTDPHYVRNIGIFMIVLLVLTILVIYSGTRAYQATDSVNFCGETCHEVMSPQFTTYQNSAHAKVPCVECHIGPGATFFVKAKIDGIRQLYATAANTFSRPIQTPVHNLRPAQETCEECHWPKQFYGEKMLTNTYYRTDEENSPWTIKMLVKIGGGNPRTGKLEGIHWHMLGPKIQYVANDEKRNEISWVRVITKENDTLIYTSPDLDQPDFENPLTDIRTFDCMDCHNRPSHNFGAPAKLLNLALSTRRISPTIPSIREEGLNLLIANYSTKSEADDSITAKLVEYYDDNYPEFANENRQLIIDAVKELLKIYDQNFFPEMKTDYRERQNNLTHFVNDGCFRCHDGEMKNQYGETLSRECNTCHLIVAQGPSENVEDLEHNLVGVEFHHPEDIDGAWKEMLCTECHTPESGY